MKFRLFILFIFLSCYCYSQTIFEFEYHFGDGDQKDHNFAFMVRNGDGTGFIRSVYMDKQTNTLNLVEMQMEEHYGSDANGNEDTSLLVFEGVSPVLLHGTKAYPPDVFIFRLNTETGFYEPHSVVSPNADGTDVEGVIDQVHLLEEKDLTEELVLEYFTKEDEFYINRFTNVVRQITAQEKQTRLFLLLVANTEDNTVGPTCVIDKNTTYKTFSQIAEFLQIQFVPKVIFGNEFSKVNVDNAISSIRPGPSDIVIFYYSGHGFNNLNETYRFPYLDLRDKSYQMFGGQYTLNMESIYQKIKMKGARLNLVLSDCCNNDPSQSPNLSADGASTRTSSIGWNMDNCRALFMNPKPLSILMTAASKGEKSAGNPVDGGIFTSMFRESLEKNMGPFVKDVTWNSLLAAAQKQTVVKANRTWCVEPGKPRVVCVQSPIFKVE